MKTVTGVLKEPKPFSTIHTSIHQPDPGRFVMEEIDMEEIDLPDIAKKLDLKDDQFISNEADHFGYTDIGVFAKVNGRYLILKFFDEYYRAKKAKKKYITGYVGDIHTDDILRFLCMKLRFQFLTKKQWYILVHALHHHLPPKLI